MASGVITVFLFAFLCGVHAAGAAAARGGGGGAPVPRVVPAVRMESGERAGWGGGGDRCNHASSFYQLNHGHAAETARRPLRVMPRGRQNNQLHTRMQRSAGRPRGECVGSEPYPTNFKKSMLAREHPTSAHLDLQRRLEIML